MEKFCVHRIDWHIADARDTFMLLLLIPTILWLAGVKFETYMTCLILYTQIMCVRYVIVKAYRYWVSNELDYADRRMCSLVGLIVWLSNTALVWTNSLYPDMATIPVIITVIYIVVALIDIVIVRDLLRNNIAKRLTHNTQAVVSDIYDVNKYHH